MLVTLFGIVTLVRPVQPENARSPMGVTRLGRVTLVRPVQPENAWSPMRVTGRPSMVLGIVAAPAVQAYLVMVIVPLFVV